MVIESGYIVILIIMLAIAGFGWWLSISQRQTEVTLQQQGTRIFATVLDVRDDRSDFETIVKYEFVDLKSGRSFSRSGVLQRKLPLPKQGDKIEIIYLSRNPKVSRLLFEENFKN